MDVCYELSDNIKNNFGVILLRFQQDQEYLEILDGFVSNKLELIICNYYQKIKKRKERDIKILKMVNELYSEFHNIYYNQYIDCFYLLEDYKFKYLSFDSLTHEINKIIKNGDLLYSKSRIKNELKKKISSSRIIYDIPISSNMISYVKNTFRNVFINENVLEFFLFFIGSCLNNMDYELFKGNIIFYGNYSIDLIELLKFSIYEITKLYIRSLTDVKFRYNNYDLKTAKLFRININNFSELKKDLKNKKELFIITCNYFYQTYQEKFLKGNIEPVFFLNKFNTKDELFLYYQEENISIDEEQQFRISDIIIDFNLFLDRKKLPTNIISKKELHYLIQNNLHHRCLNKNIYQISLQNFNKQDICLQFFNSEIIEENSNIISINQLYFFFEKWFHEQNILYNCPMRSDLKLLLSSKKIETKDHYYKNIKLLSHFDKKKICFQFRESHICIDEGQKLLLLDLKSQFDLWYQQQYSNYPLIDLHDLKFYISLILIKYDTNIFGWKGFSLKS